MDGVLWGPEAVEILRAVALEERTPEVVLLGLSMACERGGALKSPWSMYMQNCGGDAGDRYIIDIAISKWKSYLHGGRPPLMVDKCRVRFLSRSW